MFNKNNRKKRNNKKIYCFFTLILCFFLLIFFSQSVYGAESEYGLQNPLGTKVGTLQDVVANIISAVLALTGSAALIILIYGGVTLLFSAGNQEKVAKAKSIIIWAIIGVAVILGSYLILRFVFYVLQRGAGAGG